MVRSRSHRATPRTLHRHGSCWGEGIAGSCVIEDRAILAGQVGVKDHITIGRDAILEGKAGVMKDVPPEDIQVGLPAIPVRDYMKYVATRTKMADIYDDVRRMKKQIAELEKRLSDAKPSEVRTNGNGT